MLIWRKRSFVAFVRVTPLIDRFFGVVKSGRTVTIEGIDSASPRFHATLGPAMTYVLVTVLVFDM